jgi:lysylphosphatidylglycerol synthetase-like protein (DUF2156 family)
LDFIKLLKSFEELLYEVMIMLVFFPRTLWLTFRHPQRMMDYSDTELGDVQSEQFTDTLSPPLFLMICLVISHGVSVATQGATATAMLPKLLQNTQNLLALRVFVFSLFPLMLSLRLLRGLGIALDRESLRAPFYSQCFIAAPVAMAIGLCFSIGHLAALGQYASYVAFTLLVAILAWYTRQQAHWYHAKLKTPIGKSWGIAISTMVITTILAATTALLIIFAMR